MLRVSGRVTSTDALLRLLFWLHVPTARMKKVDLNAAVIGDEGSRDSQPSSQAASTAAVAAVARGGGGSSRGQPPQVEQETNDLMDDVSSPAPRAPKPRAPAAAKVGIHRCCV